MEVAPGKGARRCRQAEERQAKPSAAARIPRRYERRAFANYRPAPGYATRPQAFNHAFKPAAEYPAVAGGLPLTGPAGVGKT
jgi:hypothetical protein